MCVLSMSIHRFIHLQHPSWDRDKMAAILETTFSNALSWTKMFNFRLQFHWISFLRVHLTKKSTLVQIVAWCRTGDKTSHYLKQRWLSLRTHICVARHQWVKCLSYDTPSVWPAPFDCHIYHQFSRLLTIIDMWNTCFGHSQYVK